MMKAWPPPSNQCHDWPQGACTHIIVDDFRTATRVCISCGKVFDVLIGDGFDTGHSSSSNGGSKKDECDPAAWQPMYQHLFSHDVIIREFLMDSLAHLNLNLGFLVDKVILNLHKIAQEASSKGQRYLNLSVRHERDLGRLAYVLWDTMMEEHCPRPPSVVAHILNTTTQFMRLAEKELCRQPAYSPLTDYVPRLVAELHLPPWVSLAVEKSLWYAPNIMVAPEPLIGAVLMELGDMLDTNMTGLSHLLTRAKIASVIGCSEHRLRTLNNRLPNALIDTLVKEVGGDDNPDKRCCLARQLALYQAKQANSQSPSISYC